MSDGYFGTQAQIRLQEKSDRLTPWIMKTPGACVTGRAMCADDPGAFGWPDIRAHLAADGVFGFRWMSPQHMADIRENLADTGAEVHSWSGFRAEAGEIQGATADILARPLPPAMAQRTATRDDIPQVQQFLADQGIAPMSAAALTGALFPAAVQLIVSGDGQIAATGWSAMVQNRHSHLATTAWAGLIAVDPQWRGNKLGLRINAMALMHAVQEFGAEAAIEFAALDNAASIAMIRRSGLRSHENVSAVAMMGGAKFTR